MEQEVDKLLELVRKQTLNKAKMYDGFNSMSTQVEFQDKPIARFMFSVIEELGEVSSAYTRNRLELAKAECIDVIHSSLLLYKALENLQKDKNYALQDNNSPPMYKT